MSGSFRNKVLLFEISPPPGVWQEISGYLDADSPYDIPWSSKMQEASVPPPARAWELISSSIDNTSLTQAKVIPLIYKRLSIAVMLAAVVAASVMYFSKDRTTIPRRELALVNKRNNDIRTDVSGLASVPSPARTIAARPAASSVRLMKMAPRQYLQYPRQADYADQQDPESGDINEASFAELRTVDAEPPVSVPARPIRDAGGNIIMDLRLISKPNDPYITVTSPNGAQTKISSKFLSCLSYLNGDISNDDKNYDGLFWKDQFQSWRDKLLTGQSFIPAASNFFDIFEMKDMIQE